MGGLFGGGPDVVVPEPTRDVRPKQPPRKKQADTQQEARRQRRNRARGRGDTVLTDTLGGSGDSDEQQTTLLGG